MPPKIDLTGQKYGRLMVIEEAGRDSSGIIWKCKCDCGNEVKCASRSLKNGHTKSCGCYRTDHMKIQGKCNKIHGMALDKNGKIPAIYYTWQSMLNRCNNPNAKGYKNYGNRGITVCKRWMSFENFYADMGDKPSSKHSIERINNNKGYYPENCRWATMEEQSWNRGNPKGYYYNKNSGKYYAYITVNGKRYSLGSYRTPRKAKGAYLKAKRRLHKS